MEFLKELEEIKEVYYPGDACQWINRHLEGDAMIWWRVVRHRVSTYQQFREAFIAKFWNTQVQDYVRDGLEYRRYQWGGAYNMVQYLEHRILECRNLIPPIPDEHLIRKLSRHYSKEIEVAVLTRGVTELGSFESLLNDFMNVRNRDTRGYDDGNIPSGSNTRNWRQPKTFSDNTTGTHGPPHNKNDPARTNTLNKPMFNKQETKVKV